MRLAEHGPAGAEHHKGNGYVVAPYKDHEESFPLAELDRDRVNEFIASHADALAKRGHEVGGWRVGDQVYLDVAVDEPDEERAMALARSNGRNSIYNRQTKGGVRVAEAGNTCFATLAVPATNEQIDEFVNELKAEPMSETYYPYIDMVLALDIAEAAAPAAAAGPGTSSSGPVAARQQALGVPTHMLDTDPAKAAIADLQALRLRRLQGVNLSDDEVKAAIRARRTLRYGQPPNEAEVEAAFSRLVPSQLPGAASPQIRRGEEVVDKEKEREQAKEEAIDAAKLKQEVKAATEPMAEHGDKDTMTGAEYAMYHPGMDVKAIWSRQGEGEDEPFHGGRPSYNTNPDDLGMPSNPDWGRSGDADLQGKHDRALADYEQVRRLASELKGKFAGIETKFGGNYGATIVGFENGKFVISDHSSRDQISLDPRVIVKVVVDGKNVLKEAAFIEHGDKANMSAEEYAQYHSDTEVLRKGNPYDSGTATKDEINAYRDAVARRGPFGKDNPHPAFDDRRVLQVDADDPREQVLRIAAGYEGREVRVKATGGRSIRGTVSGRVGLDGAFVLDTPDGGKIVKADEIITIATVYEDHPGDLIYTNPKNAKGGRDSRHFIAPNEAFHESSVGQFSQTEAVKVAESLRSQGLEVRIADDGTVYRVDEEAVDMVTSQSVDPLELVEADATAKPEQIIFREAGFDGQLVTLQEAGAVFDDSKREVWITPIRPGWGNPRDGFYYTESALKDAVNSGIFNGRKMYANHPRKSDEKDLPERDVRDWVATVKETVWDTKRNQPRSRLKVYDKGAYERFKDAPEEIAFSILGGGVARPGKVGNREARIVEALRNIRSIDWVTEAGAGGAIDFAESASEEFEMSLENLTAEQLKDANPDLYAALTGMKEAESEPPAPDPLPEPEPKPEEDLAAKVERLEAALLQKDLKEAAAVANGDAKRTVNAVISESILPRAAKEYVEKRFAEATVGEGFLFPDKGSLKEAVEAEIADMEKISAGLRGKAPLASGLGALPPDAHNGKAPETVRESFEARFDEKLGDVPNKTAQAAAISSGAQGIEDRISERI